MRGWTRKASLALGAALLIVCTGVPLAQTTTHEIRNGEVISVSGNTLVYRGPDGVKSVQVPDDFTFEMNGRSMSIHDLKPGQRLTAMITTRTTPVSMTATEVRSSTVVHTTGGAVVVRDQNGELKKYTVKDMRSSNLIIHRDGKPVDIYDLRKGDELTATIISDLPPETMTETDLRVFVENAPPPTRPTTRTTSSSTAAPVRVASSSPSMPHTASPLPLVGLAGLLSLGLGAGLTALRRFRG